MLLFFLAERDSYFTVENLQCFMNLYLAQITKVHSRDLRFVSSNELSALHILLLKGWIRTCGMGLWVWGTRYVHAQVGFGRSTLYCFSCRLGLLASFHYFYPVAWKARLPWQSYLFRLCFPLKRGLQ